MKIIFNPADGADIADFNHAGNRLEPHLKYSLKQYNDADADALLTTYPFLQEVSVEQATHLAEKIKADQKEVPEIFECEFCPETFDKKIALVGHMRSHRKEMAAKEQPVVDPNLIPVAGTKKGKSRPTESSRSETMNSDPTINIPNGKDADGVEWYGDGVQEDKQSFAPQAPVGEKGHFGG